MNPTMSGLDDLYREVILDHYRNPHGGEAVENPTIEVDGHNPLCGDELKMQIEIEDGRIKRLHIDPQGCSISVASASMLAQRVEGMTMEEALELKAAFQGVLKGGEWPEGMEFGDLEALEGVQQFPVRIKCALLAWMTLEQALAQYCPGAIGKVDEDRDIEIRAHKLQQATKETE
jgi:nitrogen fixation NifU-like protein